MRLRIAFLTLTSEIRVNTRVIYSGVLVSALSAALRSILGKGGNGRKSFLLTDTKQMTLMVGDYIVEVFSFCKKKN
jgi:hypothetical protein